VSGDYGELRSALDRASEKTEALLTGSGRLRKLGGKVWVVDDKPDTADALVIMLTNEGLEAEPVLGTASAVAKLRRGNMPSLMLLDLAMPNGGGNAVLREAPHTFPVVVLSGVDDAEHALDPEHRARVTDVISKTVDPEALVARVKQILGR